MRSPSIAIGALLALAACTPDMPDVGVTGAAVTCDPVVTRYPVRGRHNHGYDRTAGDSSMWSCDDAHSNEDFVGGDHIGNDIPPNAEAWDRLLKYVRDHETPEALLRQTA